MLTVFIALYTLAVIYVSVKFVRLKSKGEVWETLILFFIFCVFGILKSVYKLEIHEYILALVIVTFIGHSFLGRGVNLYNSSKHFDRYLHAFGAFSFALFAYALILAFIRPAVYTDVLAAILVFALGVTLGTLLEMVEFFGDSISKSKGHQRGLLDTDHDLLADIFGSLAAGLFVFFSKGI